MCLSMVPFRVDTGSSALTIAGHGPVRDARLAVIFVGGGLFCLAGAVTAVYPPVGISMGAAAGAILLSRRLTGLVVAYLVAAVFADYVSSWLPLVAGFPAGGMVRDYLALTILMASAWTLFRGSDRSPQDDSTIARVAIRGSQLPLLALWLLSCLLVLGAPSIVVGLLGARNVLLYPTVAVACWLLIYRGRVRASTINRALLVLFAVAATLGVLDAATNSHILDLLGYTQSYAGSEFGVVAGQNALVLGVGRASGGISNALVYGYLMATGAVFAVYGALVIDRSSRHRLKTFGYLGLATIAAIACALSLTRGAIIALVLGALVLVIRTRSARFASSALLVAILVGSVIVALGPADVIVSRLRAADVSSQLSTQTRFDEAAAGIDRLLQQPFGTGYGTEGSASLHGGDVGVAGDIFLLIVALQIGIPGFVAFSLVLASWMFAAFRSARREGALLSAAIAIYIVAAVLSGSPDAPVYAAPFWLLLVSASVWSAAPPSSQPTENAGPVRWAASSRQPGRAHGADAQGATLRFRMSSSIRNNHPSAEQTATAD